MSTSLTTIIVGVLALLGTLGGSWLGVVQSNKLVNWRIDKLEEAVTKHNNMLERMVKVEASTKSAHKRLDAIAAPHAQG